MQFGKLVGFLTLLSLGAWNYCLAEAGPCYGEGQRPLVNKSAPNIGDYSYTVDKEPPYKYSEDRYAHERFVLNKHIKVHVEHRGCPFPDKNQVNITFSVPGKLKSYKDTQFWINQALTLIQSLDLCSSKRVSDWCQRLKRAQTEKLKCLVDPDATYNEGIWLSLEEDSEHNEIFLLITVHQYDTHVDLNVGTAFVGYDG